MQETASMARRRATTVSTTQIALVLLILHNAAASRESSSWGYAPVNFSDEPHHDIGVDYVSGTNDIQYSSPRRRQQQDQRKPPSLVGSGREFTLFDQRGADEDDDGGTIPASSTAAAPPNGPNGGSDDGTPPAHRNNDGPNDPYRPFQTRSSLRRRKRSSRYGTSYPTGGGTSRYSPNPTRPGGARTAGRPVGTNPLSNLREWITTSGNLPRIQCRVEPNTTLKVRKTFRPLKTTVRLGADFNTQLGVWQFKSSWEDRIIGGKLTLAGREMQFCKTWLLSVGVVEDLVTRLRLRAAVDLGTMKAYARLGFRTERLSPINVVEGFTLTKQLPLDGNYGHVKLEVKANFAFPEPEIEYSTENHRSFVGMGDIEVNIDELNLLLNY